VEVKEWGCTLLVKEMSVADRIKWHRLYADKKDSDDTSTVAQYLVFCLFDLDGKRIFEPKPEDIAALATKSQHVLIRLQDIASKLNATGGEAIEAAKKNSSTTP
jgi:hypothetical protein